MEEEPLRTGPKPFVFVLMPFGREFSDYYKYGIKAAAEKVGAYAERIDEQIFQENILQRVFNQIAKADVIVADMTGRNPNVFYEVGYAHALDKTVLLLTQDADDIPFDLKQCQHLVYEGSIEILERELIRQLNWAVKEKRRGSRREQLVITFQGQEIPQQPSNDIPSFEVQLDSDENCTINLSVRNASLDATPEITHAYILGETSGKLVPGYYEERTTTDYYQPPPVMDPNQGFIHQPQQAVQRTVEKLVCLVPAEARGEEAFRRQYRLKAALSPLPPDGTEILPLYLHLEGSEGPATALMKLRLHIGHGTQDYIFRVLAK